MATMLKMTPTSREAEARREAHVEHIVLDDASFDEFSATVENPPAPNAKLIAMFKKNK